MCLCMMVVERDFSTAGWLSKGSRSRLDAAFNQMVLFLNGTLADIPSEVRVLTEEGKGQNAETAVKSSASRRGRVFCGTRAKTNSTWSRQFQILEMFSCVMERIP